MKIGTKAELKAPSAKILRKKLGKRKEAKKTSDNIPAPRYLAIRISLINPRTLEIDIKKETVTVERIIDIYIDSIEI